MDNARRAPERDGELFRLLAENVKDYAIFILDPSGLVQTWTRGAEHLIGYKADEVIGEPFAKFFTESDLAARAPEQEIEQALRTGRGEDDRWHVRKDGTTFWCSGVMTPLRDESGQLRGFAKIMRDLTEQKRNEQYRNESEERFALLVEGVVDYALIMLNTDGNIVTWNNGAQRLYGYNSTEMLGRHHLILSSGAHDQREDMVHCLEEAQSKSRYECEGWRIRKDGSRFLAHVIITALYDEQGQLRGFGKVTRDITEHERLTRELQEANRQKDISVAMLAHELRNPLAAMMNALRLLQRASENVSKDGPAGTMERQLRKLVSLVDDLLDVARFTTGEFKLEKEPVPVGSLLQRAVETMSPTIEARRQTLVVSALPEQTYLRIDPYRIEQVINNLLGNASKFTDPGGQITLAASLEGESVSISVKDNGPGIPPDALSRIFDLFYQTDRSLERRRGGFGIGLALVKKLVEVHGGTVEARSPGLGFGSEFIVRLPRASTAPHPAELVPDTTHASGTGRRCVLLVEDNLDAAETLAMLLRLEQHEVKVANTGSAALALLNRYAPDVILMDIGLPEMSGYELVQRVREDERFRHTPVFAISGYGLEDDRRRALEAGFNGLLVKPVEPAKILALIAGI